MLLEPGEASSSSNYSNYSDYGSYDTPLPTLAQHHRLLDHPDHHAEFTPQQELILNWTARTAAILSFLGGLYIFYGAWNKRDQVYHRIMLAVSIYILLWSPWMVYGVAAIPEGTPDVLGAHGTLATCTAQGFFNQLSTAVPAYYVALSGFSWIVVVQGNFDPTKYAWVEKYIHLLVNAWAVGSSTTLAVLEALNPSEGWPSCYIGAVPMGCGEHSGIECTRGPQNIARLLAIFVGLPVLVLLLVPTLTMVALASYLHWRSRGGSGGSGGGDRTHGGSSNGSSITVRAVTKQSCVYLGTLYFIYLPGLLSSSLGNFFGNKHFGLSCVGNFVAVSMGIWYALSYRYFAAPQPSGGSGKSQSIRGMTRNGFAKVLEPTLRRTIRGSCSSNAFSMSDNPKSDPLDHPGTTDNNDNNDDDPDEPVVRIDSLLRAAAEESPTESSFSEAPPPKRDNDDDDDDDDDKASKEFRKSFSFNIFDGTAPSQSQWAEFIFEGDESDAENDLEETRYWAGCQEGA